MMSKNGAVLSDLAQALASGSVKVVDLTETLTEDYPVIQLPPEFGQASSFKKEEISRYDDRGVAWYWNNFTLSEHTGTHFDAPIHWITGKDLPNNSVDTIDPARFVAPVCVVDCSREVAADQDFILTRDVMEDWEKQHGAIPAGAWVFMRSDWRNAVPKDRDLANRDENGAPHNPGPNKEAVDYMIERDVIGFGTECVGTDHGNSFNWDPMLPCHTFLHGAGKYGLQCMTNLDKLPPKGAIIISPPLKIEEGSGSPLRVLALVPA